MGNETVDELDIAVMRVLDGLRTEFEWVADKILVEKLPYSHHRIKKSLDKLERLGLIHHRYVKPLGDWGSMLKEKGFDTLALWDFKKHGIIETIGNTIGMGKEATVINAISPDGEWLAVKFHRWWIKEFRQIKKSLSYASVVVRGRELNLEDYKIDIPRAKAQIEFFALQKLFKLGINVPEPLGINRHAIVTKLISSKNGLPAPQLVNVVLENPRDAYDMIIEDYVRMVNDGKTIHGDFNEFNILIGSEGTLYYIDFPQAVPTDYPAARELFERDVTQINRFFKNKYSISVELPDVILEKIRV